MTPAERAIRAALCLAAGLGIVTWWLGCGLAWWLA